MRARTPKIVIAGVALAIALATTRDAGADCAIGTPREANSTAIATPTTPVGESFVACEDGIITNLAVYVGLYTQPSFRIGLQQGIDLLHPETVVVGDIPAGATRIRVDPGFRVVAGRLYSFSVAPTSGTLRLLQITGTAYPEGSLLLVDQGIVTPRPEIDLQFSLTTMGDPPVPAVASTWGAIKSTYR